MLPAPSLELDPTFASRLAAESYRSRKLVPINRDGVGRLAVDSFKAILRYKRCDGAIRTMSMTLQGRPIHRR